VLAATELAGGSQPERPHRDHAGGHRQHAQRSDGRLQRPFDAVLLVRGGGRYQEVPHALLRQEVGQLGVEGLALALEGVLRRRDPSRAVL
jgi:hypothetical protein